MTVGVTVVMLPHTPTPVPEHVDTENHYTYMYMYITCVGLTAYEDLSTSTCLNI